jgi:UDP-N-acetylmuramate dehydrogenase
MSWQVKEGQGITDLIKKELGNLVQENRSLAPLTTARLGGPARYFVEAHTISHLKKALAISAGNNIPFLVIGRGSNVLVSDSGFNGMVIKLGRDFHRLHLERENIISGAAVPLPELVRLAQVNSLDGLAFAVGIPGSVGGAIKMNAGAFGECIADRISKVTVMDERGELKVLQRSEIDFGYRRSNIKEVILEGMFTLKRGVQKEINRKMEMYFQKRKNAQPIGLPNTGSVFKNPEDEYAARLIEGAGCKGLKLGRAQVSEQHANFIVNLGGAKASDVYRLLREVQKRVQEKYGILLEPEIVMVGDFDE